MLVCAIENRGMISPHKRTCLPMFVILLNKKFLYHPLDICFDPFVVSTQCLQASLCYAMLRCVLGIMPE